MNGYKTRSPREQHYNHTSEPTSMATYESTSSAPELPYHSSGSYNVPQPYNSYSSHLPPYFEPQTSMAPEMHSTIPSLRHDQNLNQQHYHHHSGRETPYMGGPSGFPSSRFISLFGVPESEVESQDSIPGYNKKSEPINPPLAGFPLVEDFDKLMESELSVKKQDKALINAQRASNIRSILLDPKDTTIGSAQFRFWVKKMFKLDPIDNRHPVGKRWICHEGKPVAIREKLFKILTRAHQQSQHGGRDKTSAQVRQIYSWVPKELISRFVKICPTCQIRRGGSHLSPPDSRRNSPPMEHSGAQQSYMRGQPASSGAYDNYRRKSSSSSSYGYSEGNRESSTTTWSYSSPVSHHRETGWSHHSSGHGGDSSQNGRTSSSMKHTDTGYHPPPPSSSSSSGGQILETSPSRSQAQYHSGYTSNHSNGRYRSGY